MLNNHRYFNGFNRLNSANRISCSTFLKAGFLLKIRLFLRSFVILVALYYYFGGCSAEKREHLKNVGTELGLQKKNREMHVKVRYPGFRFYQNLKYYIRMVTIAFRGKARRMAFASFSGMQIRISGV